MSLPEIILIAVGLSMDAFAVAMSKGLGMRRREHGQAIAIALTFGLFQGGMPLIGWLVGSQFAGIITSFDHWIAFGLLAIVGGRMLWEAFADGDEDGGAPASFSVRQLLVLAVATSIDALAAGIGFAFLKLDIWLTVGLIAATTAVLSFIGVVAGHRFGSRFERPAEIAGGVILVLIGTKILLDHLGLLPF